MDNRKVNLIDTPVHMEAETYPPKAQDDEREITSSNDNYGDIVTSRGVRSIE
ncbi:conserved hypothetical protein [Ricinus communis]|uniref:Uncharacterized protein n=1 Tax=Ricinus communis TaxID=3988 RepID=B9SU18_RICCO|nr:conserved hypothetical protein [Ricinus communis]